jgi:hypothetical protein
MEARTTEALRSKRFAASLVIFAIDLTFGKPLVEYFPRCSAAVTQ